jgi:uncharacterized protein YjbI with pentapeptide repeats
MKQISFGVTCLCLLIAVPSWAQEPRALPDWAQVPLAPVTCPHPKDWRPTRDELQRILSEHVQWLTRRLGVLLQIVPNAERGRANLCNADLGEVDLSNAQLSEAILNNARVVHANNAVLRLATLNNANLHGAELNSADLAGAMLNGADLSFSKLNGADLAGAELSNAKLDNVELKDAKLNSAHLQGAELKDAKLNSAHLQGADLKDAKLEKTDLSEADLNNADLSGAKLKNANLSEAKLNNARLNGAELRAASVAGAKLGYADLTTATYAPESAPPSSDVAGIRGLSTVTFPAGEVTGLVQLRDLLQKGGLRDLEREATFAIESGRTKTASPTEGLFRYVAFDLTVAYGLQPSRALLLIAALWALLIPIYAWPIWRSKRPPTASGVYRIWPKERVEVREDRPTLDDPARIERLHGRGLAAVGWSAYFSLLSTFQIGFREFTVGTWLTRTQPRNFSLESTGWVRTVSGIQSLLSVYLLAMWLLSYFGRPFQ